MKTRDPLLLALATVLVAGCVAVPGAGYSSRPPARSVERVYELPPPVEPPPPFRAPRPHQPSRAHVWLDGYWDWDGGRYFWQPGRWAVPPQGQVWEAHRWVHSSKRGWVLIEGRWRGADDQGGN